MTGEPGEIKNYYGDTIEGLIGLFALQNGKWEIVMHKYLQAVKDDEVPRVLSYPQIQTVVIHAPRGKNRKADFGDLDEWARLLRHVMESCPNLQVLDVLFESVMRESSFDRMTEFKSHVFPQLPQETKACVNIVFGMRLEKGHFQDLPAEDRAAIDRNFVEEAPKEKHIPAKKYYTRIFYFDDEVSLCRVTNEEKGGVEPWGIMLQINTFEIKKRKCNLI